MNSTDTKTQHFGHRLRILVKDYEDRSGDKLTQSKLGTLFETSQPGVGKWFNGSVPESEKIKDMAVFFGCDPLWLIYGDTIPLVENDDLSELPEIDLDSTMDATSTFDQTDIPMGEQTLDFMQRKARDYSVTIARFKDRRAKVDHGETEKRIRFKHSWIEQKGLDARKVLIVDVYDQAMFARIQAGDMLLVNTEASFPLESGCVYAFDYNGQSRVRRVDEQNDGSIVLRCDNPAYKETTEVISSEAVQTLVVLGQVVWVCGEVR